MKINVNFMSVLLAFLLYKVGYSSERVVNYYSIIQTCKRPIMNESGTFVKTNQILSGFETATEHGDHFTAVLSGRSEQSSGLH